MQDTTIIPVSEQPKDRMYKMSIKFVADLTPTKIAGIMKDFGFNEAPVFPKAITTRIVQTCPFIPDEATLEKYADILNGTQEGEFRLANATFDGYDYIYMVEPTNPEKKEDEDNE